MARIKFTTDSASDIPAPLREELNIQVFPFPIAMEDRELADAPGVLRYAAGRPQNSYPRPA